MTSFDWFHPIRICSCTASVLAVRRRFDPSGAGVRHSPLPGLDQVYADDSAHIGSEDVVSRNVTRGGGWAIFKGRMFPHDVLDDQLDIDSLQVIVRRYIAGVVAERQIERIKRRFDLGVVADRAGEGTAAGIAARGRALEIDIGR